MSTLFSSEGGGRANSDPRPAASTRVTAIFGSLLPLTANLSKLILNDIIKSKIKINIRKIIEKKMSPKFGDMPPFRHVMQSWIEIFHQTFF